MRRRKLCSLLALAISIAACGSPKASSAQAKSPGARQQGDTVPATPAPTKLEAFRPAAGSVLTVGYNELGSVNALSIDAKELRDSKSGVARGLVVQVRESQYREERSFVDLDELPELLKGADAVLAVKTNPTSFKQFEVRYRTRGDLQLVAFNNSQGVVSYAVQVGRVTTTSAFLSEAEMQRVRGMIDAGMKLLAAP